MEALPVVGGRAGAGSSGISHAGTWALRPNQGASRRLGPTHGRARCTDTKHDHSTPRDRGEDTETRPLFIHQGEMPFMINSWHCCAATQCHECREMPRNATKCHESA